MPTEKLIPYELEIYEKRNTNNRYNLSNLHAYDTNFPDSHILDIFEDYLESNSGTNLEGRDSDKTLVIEQVHRDGNEIEGIVSSGFHGYEAELRNVETDRITHQKGENEAEQLPLYFLIYYPETTEGELYDDGKTLFIILHQVNRIGVKTKLNKYLKENAMAGVQNTTWRLDPVASEEVLQKVIDADRILETDIHIREIPGDDEQRTDLVRGMESSQTDSKSLVLKPEHGGSLSWLRNTVRNAVDSDTHFGEFVAEEVEDVSVTIQKEGGRNETFSLLTEEIAMRKTLDDNLEKDGGLITAEALRSESESLLNEDIFSDSIIQPIQGDTNIER